MAVVIRQTFPYRSGEIGGILSPNDVGSVGAKVGRELAELGRKCDDGAERTAEFHDHSISSRRVICQLRLHLHQRRQRRRVSSTRSVTFSRISSTTRLHGKRRHPRPLRSLALCSIPWL